MTVIDADAHVIETERTWEFMEESEIAFRPRVLVPKEGGSEEEFWLVDGRAFPRHTNVMREAPAGSREMADVSARLAHMNELGVDIQVLYPTIFLRPLTRQIRMDAAISRSYNRWMAEIWRMGEERLLWAVIPPLLNMDKAIEELNFGKEHGAVSVFMRGVEAGRRLSDPYFYPLYEEASRLNLAMGVHSANGSFDVFDAFNGDSGLSTFKLPVVGAFHDLIMKGVPAQFPDLRWAFVEVSSQWVPYVLHDMGIRLRKRDGAFVHSDVLRDNRIYVACQTDDDLAYVLEYTGEDNVILGTDYGHNDTASEIDALRQLKRDGKVAPSVVDKILGDNAKAVYGL